MGEGGLGGESRDGAADAGDRAVSPVVGTVLLLGIVLVLVSVGTVMFFDLTEQREPAPEVVVDVESDDSPGVYRLTHSQGETLRPEKLTLRGAANPETFAEEDLGIGGKATFVAIDDEVTLIWTGEHGTGYVLRTFELDDTLPDPDEACDWVDSETNGGTTDAKIDGTVVNCDVETDDFVKLLNDGVIIGRAASGAEYVETDSSRIYGDVTVEKTVDADASLIHGDVEAGKTINLQDGTTTGAATSTGADVKLTNGTVDGSVTADAGIDVQDGSSVGGDVVSDNANTVDVDDATIDGDVMSEGTVNLNNVTVEGDVYTSDFKCTDATIDGQSCGDYTPKSPSDW